MNSFFPPKCLWMQRLLFSSDIIVNSSTKWRKTLIFFKGCSFYDSPCRKIKCCPDSRFSGSIYMRHNDRRCSFGPNTLFSYPKTLDNHEACTPHTKFGRATHAAEPKGWRHPKLWIWEPDNVSSCYTEHTVPEKCRRQSHLWGQVCRGSRGLQGEEGSQTLVKAGLGLQLKELEDLNEAKSDSTTMSLVRY